MASNAWPWPEKAPSAGAKQSKQPGADPSADQADSAITLLIRRTLCAPEDQTHLDRELEGNSSRAIPGSLPSLTSSDEVDLQLYALVAMLVRDQLLPWYRTWSNDQEVVDKLVHLTAHCSRGLEQRLREVDLEAFLLDDIPTLWNRHIQAYRTAFQPRDQLPPSLAQRRDTYHALFPHPALDCSAKFEVCAIKEPENLYRRGIAEGIVANLLPAEEVDNSSLRQLLTVMLGMAMYDLSQRASEASPWLDGIIQLVAVLKAAPAEVEKPSGALGKTGSHWKGGSMTEYFWMLMHVLILAMTWLGHLLAAIGTSFTLPSRFKTRSGKPTEGRDGGSGDRAIIQYGCWTMLGSMINLRRHMPWVEGLLQLGQHSLLTGSGKLGEVDGLLDRYLAHAIKTKILQSASVPLIISKIREAIPPRGAPPRERLWGQRLEDLRKECALAILSVIPPAVRVVYLATDDEAEQVKQVEHDVLDLFDDPIAMKHFLFAVLDRVIALLVPEMATVEFQKNEGGQTGIFGGQGVHTGKVNNDQSIFGPPRAAPKQPQPLSYQMGGPGLFQRKPTGAGTGQGHLGNGSGLFADPTRVSTGGLFANTAAPDPWARRASPPPVAKRDDLNPGNPFH